MLFSTASTGALMLAAMAPAVIAQSPIYGQCGGSGWSGSTSCASGSCCTYSNAWYSQCLPCSGGGGGGNPTTTRAMTTTNKPVPTTTTKAAPPATTSSSGGGGGGSSGGSSGCGKNQAAGTFTKTTTVNGKQRQYIINIQNGYKSDVPHRLAFGFHGWGDSAEAVATGQRGFAPFFGLPPLANDATGLISVAPQGLNNAWANSGGEDIAFVDQMVKEIEATYCVNQNLRFATGFSYGASMTYAIACARAKQFRAVALDSGAILSGCAGGNDPIAFYEQHGVSDGTIPYNTGKGLIAHFAAVNGCSQTSGADTTNGSGQFVQTNFKGCKYPTTWVSFDGGHTSTPSLRGQPTFTPGTTWAFFKQFS